MEDSINASTIEVPDSTLSGWQNTVNVIASMVEIPASLIMRAHSDHIEIFVSSQSSGNPYKTDDSESLACGLYCETVIKNDSELLVANALKDPHWQHSPDIALGMISYLGLPLHWPTGDIFGTICVLDNKENAYSTQYRQLLNCCQFSIEASLSTLYKKAQLEHANSHLEQRVHRRTFELENLNHRLAQEIDHRAAAEQKIYRQKHYDQLTDLPNLNLLKEKLANLTDKLAPDLAISVLHLRVNNIKNISDSLGFHICDQFINIIAQRLRKNIPATTFIAHPNRDEFAVVRKFPKSSVVESSAMLASQLCQQINESIFIDGHTIPFSINIGISLCPNDATDADELLRKSSASLEFKNAQPDNQYQFYNNEMHSQLSSRMQIESKLANALAENEFDLHYQPFVDASSRKIVGAEVLLRWLNPILGNIPPDRFIPIAEQNGQIIEIGYFVMRKAIAQAAKWHKGGGSEFLIAVNISPLQFSDINLARQIEQLLATYELPPKFLEIEITEGVLMQDEDKALETLVTLSELGVRISLDDFGTGYSSLSYLRKFPFDTVKIDRSFIARTTDCNRDRELVKAIIAMAHQMKLTVIAEGIETTDQASLIRKEQCDIGQGFFYGRPVNADDFTQQFINTILISRA